MSSEPHDELHAEVCDCHLDDVLDTAPCGFLAFRDDGTITLTNATLLELVQRRLEEVKGQRLEVLLPTASRIFYQTHFFPLLKLQGKVEEIYLPVCSRTGEDLPMLVNATRHEREGEVLNECILIPIQQRSHYEEALLQARREAEAAMQAQFRANAELEQARNALEQKQVELEALNARLEELVQQRTAELEQALEFEALLKRITDRVRDSLDEGQILQTAVQELGAGLALVGCNAGIYNATQTQVAIDYEYHQDGSASRSRVEALTPEAAVMYAAVMQGNSGPFCCCLPVCPRYGAGRWAILARPIYDDQGVLGDLWLFRLAEQTFSEVEDRLLQQVANHCAIALRQSRLYQSAQTQLHEMEELNQLKDDLLNTVSHEMRSPMSNILMAIQLLEVHLEPLGVFADEAGIVTRYFRVLQDESQREIRLINNLLEMARVEAGTDLLNISTIPLQFFIPYIAEPYIERAGSPVSTVITLFNQRSRLIVFLENC
ncbi:histidine kinase dimerization/phospho-acceptor domain-containing protein [Leptolyngbya sp. O-77]|uniref:histidine kinase dimerization/phospho-acceptor domain-containing protein n=1 Tax=Leptolyngbya sp. O-77 TaxID=1080068 RepID=UPI00074D4D44|nr:histidine kinase dimerization/phospho-acceptor domain-containing protein [Leptolyngbya sp. O-77]BAU40990.1 Phosphoserine phosphatase RsbP [Leptolyngbya sp. O-77]